MHKHQYMPTLHNAIIYNPCYIDYYLLQTLQEFKSKFKTMEPYPHAPSFTQRLTTDELMWARLEVEDALSEVFLRQRDESRLLLKERLATIAILVSFETLIWHTRGILLTLYSVLPTAGVLEISTNIIAKHKGFKNELYSSSVAVLEKMLAIVKSPDRYQTPEKYQEQIKTFIHDAQKHVAVKRSEIKEALDEPNPRTFFSIIADKVMYVMCRILAAMRIFGIKIPSKADMLKWHRKIMHIAPLPSIHSWPTYAEGSDNVATSDEEMQHLKRENQRLLNEVDNLHKRLAALEKQIHSTEMFM